MKYSVNQVEEVDLLTTTVEEDMTLSEDSTGLIFQIFSKNIYSNPIGSVVREITSNCFDSHVEAKTDFPVVIRKNFDKLNNNYSISFIDFGVGMSPERINKIYRKYFTSTKRDGNDQIGCFGLGSKTPLAYKRSTGYGVDEYDNSYQVITTFDGIKYSYLVYEGQNKFPKITLQDQQSSKESNGTEVLVPVLANDIYKFEREMIKQLYYFENVIFEGFDEILSDGTVNKSELTNEYQIVRGKNFLFRGNQYSDYMHICLGRVAYPIDYGVLGLEGKDYRIPIALRLEVGDINVIVSRESIDYSESTIKMITKKLELAKGEIKELLAKQYENVVSLEDYFNVKADFGRLQFTNGESIFVGNLISKNDVDFSNFKYSELIVMPDDKNLFKFFFENKLYGKKPSESGRRRRKKFTNLEPVSPYFEGGYEDLLKNNANVFYCDGEFTRKVLKQAYLKATYGTFFIVTKEQLMYAVRKDIADLFHNSLDTLTDDKGQLLPFVQMLIDMQEDYFEIVRKHCTHYDDIVVPESFVITRKRAAITAEMRNTTIPVRIFNERGCDKQERIKLDQLFNFKEPIYYCTKENKNEMQNAVRVFTTLFTSEAIVDDYDSYKNVFRHSGKKKIMFLVLSTNNLKYLEFCNDARPINTIYQKLFYRKADAVSNYFQTYELIEEYKQIPSLYRHASFESINKKWSDKVKTVRDFISGLKYLNSNLGNNKYELNKYFNTESMGLTPEQKKIKNIMQEINKLHEKNDTILSFINLPYRTSDTMEDKLVDILKKVMIF
ncbi:MAG: hypothetical protein WC428_02120 [Candidatus Paceibacterota bacterium]|jgi:hypothetical protein